MRTVDRRQQLLTTRLTLRLQAPYTHSGSFSSAYRSKCVRAAILSQFLRFAGLCCCSFGRDGAGRFSAFHYRTMIADCPTKVNNEGNVDPNTYYCRGPTAVNCATCSACLDANENTFIPIHCCMLQFKHGSTVCWAPDTQLREGAVARLPDEGASGHGVKCKLPEERMNQNAGYRYTQHGHTVTG